MWGWLILAGVLGIPYLLANAAGRYRDRLWRAWAEDAGVTDLVPSGFLGIRRRLTGRFGPLRVSFGRYRAPDEYGTRIVIAGLGHAPGELALRAESVGAAIKKTLGAREIETGDPPFDDETYVRGDPRVVHAVLDAETRWLLRGLLNKRVSAEMRRLVAVFGLVPGFEDRKARVGVADDSLWAEMPGSGPSVPVAEILAVAQRLVAPRDIPERLAHNARHDSRSGVQLANLLTLAREYPDHAQTRPTLRGLCQDSPDGEVRLRAAIELGEEGWETLRQVASSLSTEDSCAARALDALGEGLIREQAEVFLQRTLPHKRFATACAAIRALGRIGGAEVVAPLVAALDADDETVVVAAVTALGEAGAGEAEDALIGALGSRSPELRIPLAEALGRVGTARAVPSLRELASRHPLDLGVRRATRQAIAGIQSRLEGATPGQISLAGDESGRLSLAGDDRRGQVSLSGEGRDEPEGVDASSAATVLHIQRARPRGVVFTAGWLSHDIWRTWRDTMTRMMEVGFHDRPVCFITPAETASTRDLDWDEIIPVCETYAIGGYPYFCAFDPGAKAPTLRAVAESQDFYLGPVWMTPLTQLDKHRLFGLVEAMLKAGLFDWPQTDEEILYPDPDGEIVYWLNPSIAEEAILEELARLAKEANWRVESEFAGR